MDRKDLIIKAIEGDMESFSEIFDLYKNPLYYYIKSHLGNENDIEDVLQETFISAFKSIKNLKNPDSFKSWLYSIAYFRTMDMVRKNQKSHLPSKEEGEEIFENIEERNPDHIPSETLLNDETKAFITELIKEFSAEQKTAILLYYYEQMSVSEIAAVMNCSSGTVKSRLNYARKHIKERIDTEEKKGNKIIALAPFPLLTQFLLWQSKQTQLSDEASQQIWTGIKSKALVYPTGRIKKGFSKHGALGGFHSIGITTKIILAAVCLSAVILAVKLLPGTGMDAKDTPVDPSISTSHPAEDQEDILQQNSVLEGAGEPSAAGGEQLAKPLTKAEYAAFYYDFIQNYHPEDELLKDAEMADENQDGNYALLLFYASGNSGTFSRVNYDKAMQVINGEIDFSYSQETREGNYELVHYDGQELVSYYYAYEERGQHVIFHLYRQESNIMNNLHEGASTQQCWFLSTPPEDLAFEDGVAAVNEAISQCIPVSSWGTEDYQGLNRLISYMDGF